MAVLTVNEVGLAGFRDDNALVAAAGGGDQILPGPTTYIRVNNGGGSPIIVTVATPGTIGNSGLAQGDVSVSVTNAQSRLIGPFPAHLFADPTDGLVDITYSGVTSVTVGAFKLVQLL
jgi:hypothetical protein